MRIVVPSYVEVEDSHRDGASKTLGYYQFLVSVGYNPSGGLNDNPSELRSTLT